MTTTDTPAPPRATAVPSRELTQAEFLAEGTALFGPSMRLWAFECPTCGSIATPGDFPKGHGDLSPVECLGRHGAEGRCKRAAYGFIPGPWFVRQSDGSVVSCFPFAAPSQEPQRAAQDSATPVDHASPETAPDATVGVPVAMPAFLAGAETAYWSVERGWTDASGTGCACHISAPCSICESLTECEHCEIEVYVPEREMAAHLAEVHPGHEIEDEAAVSPGLAPVESVPVADAAAESEN